MTTDQSIPLRILIDGRWEDGAAAPLHSLEPAHPERAIAVGAFADDDQVARAIEAAHNAAIGWGRAPARQRAAVLVRAAALLRERREALGRELSREEGKTLKEGIGEVTRAADIFEFYAAEADREAGEVFASPRPGERILVVRKPVGVVGLISPFNFPIAIPAWKLAPALVYGNTIVWKPASDVPLLAQRLAEALVEAGVPDGVVNLVYGEGEVGSAIVDSPDVAAITFTGSTAVGRMLMARCGQLGKPIQTEMGGQNAAIVLADADLDLAAREIVAAAFGASGQKCTATARVIAEESIAERITAEIARRADALIVGDPLSERSDLGPLVSAAARDAFMRAMPEESDGTRVCTTRSATDDPALAGSAYVTPIVVELESTDHPLWRDEVFGPVLAIVRTPDAARALELANDSRYGLSGAVFTRDLAFALEAIDRFDVGVLHVNTGTSGADLHVPFGGAKDSGFGAKEQGRAPREFYTRTTTVYLKA